MRAGSVVIWGRMQALVDFRDLQVVRYPYLPLLDRIWELGPNLSAHDAAYVALAEILDAPLVTADEKIARAPGHVARIEVYR